MQNRGKAGDGFFGCRVREREELGKRVRKKETKRQVIKFYPPFITY